MDRKKFIKKSLLTGLGVGFLPQLLQAEQTQFRKIDELKNRVGFNHLPNKEITTMGTVIHRANSRGHANHGWLDTHHTFSFANYHNPERMHFGVLRVLNDDKVSPAKGFSTHPHHNMEIVSIPLEGDLEHKDSMGNVSVIKEGDVQVMSAGTGIFHSEYNKNKDKDVRFLQIWVFPREKEVEPRYDQISIREVEKQNEFYQILSPNPDDQGVWVHQDAWFSLGRFDAGKGDTYSVKRTENGVYLFVLEGDIMVNGEELSARDGMGIWDTPEIKVDAKTPARVLLMDVPLQL